MDQDGTRQGDVDIGPGHIVLDGEPAPLPKKGTEPQFSAHVYCAQTAGWIKTALGMEDGKADGCIDTLMSSLHCTKMWRTLVH